MSASDGPAPGDRAPSSTVDAGSHAGGAGGDIMAGLASATAGDAGGGGEAGVWELRARVRHQGGDREFLVAESFGLRGGAGEGQGRALGCGDGVGRFGRFTKVF